jgi:hypothetical protein
LGDAFTLRNLIEEYATFYSKGHILDKTKDWLGYILGYFLMLWGNFVSKHLVTLLLSISWARSEAKFDIAPGTPYQCVINEHLRMTDI